MADAKLFILLGVVLIGVISADQSEESTPDEEPIASSENNDKQRRNDVPEVVLQLKYTKGELNKIYLTQFRKGAESWTPSVSVRGSLCADLCHAGLGGAACGSTCPQLMPVGLQAALQDGNFTNEEVYGQPRYSVCPVLCNNHLGAPLCNCPVHYMDLAVNWSAVCAAFCNEGYTLNGCPTCERPSAVNAMVYTSTARVFGTSDGWAAWCNVQCQQGQGGAACNCDRSPFQ